MKLAALCLLSAVYAAASNLAADLQPAATIPSLSDEAAPEPTVLSAEDNAILDARQAPANPTAVQAESAPPTITTDWRPTVLPNKQTTWYPDIYTQTFPKIPGQLPSPGVGSIGYGTLSKKNGKRTAEPEAAGAGAEVTATVLTQPIVLVVQTTVVLQPVQRVTEVRVVETVLEFASSASSSSSPAAASFHPTGTGALYATGTGSHGTAALPIAKPRNGTVEWFLRKEGG